MKNLDCIVFWGVLPAMFLALLATGVDFSAWGKSRSSNYLQTDAYQTPDSADRTYPKAYYFLGKACKAVFYHELKPKR